MENEGNIEICNDYGVWSAVYDYYWDYSDAFVACRQLNYRDFSKWCLFLSIMLGRRSVVIDILNLAVKYYYNV